ncbi:hypothetical protein AYO44_10485 [Planctomycetaceae bacterium SCGC AG-212-F19]|nr:hypothetical protein AYO44_10485 [Planctomycetaceae bacterium SCGC AG-212-F19]
MNGNKVVWWLMGILATLLTGGTTAWLTSMHTLSRIHGEKIAVLESQIEAQRHQLDRMDHKLDRLLEREKGPR